jgi:hypothetical protein
VAIKHINFVAGERGEKRERAGKRKREKEKETEGKEIYKDWKSERERGEMCCFSMTRTDLC